MANRGPLTILLDTNFLLLPSRFNVDLFLEFDRLVIGSYRCVITPAIFEELGRVSGKEVLSRAGEYRLAFLIAKRCTMLKEPLGPGEEVDEQILRLSVRNRYTVATTDADLRRKLRKQGVPVIYLRQRNHLDVDGSLIG